MVSDVKHYTFVPVLDSGDGQLFGMFAFDGAVPDQSEIYSFIGKYREDGIDDWCLDDLLADLMIAGYEVCIVDIDDPFYA